MITVDRRRVKKRYGSSNLLVPAATHTWVLN
jgi:hypothetical protein